MFTCKFEEGGQVPVDPEDLKTDRTYKIVESDAPTFPVDEYVVFFRLPTSNIVTHVLIPSSGEFYTADAFTGQEVKVAPGEVLTTATWDPN